MSEKKSWGQRIVRLKFPGIEKCSAPGCEVTPEFRIFMRTAGGSRRLNYCRSHALAFSKSYRLAMPPLNAGDAMRIDLYRFSSDALEILVVRIKQEQLARCNAPEDLTFSYDERGMAGKGKAPYASRIYFKNDQLKHFFFNLTCDELPGNRVRVHGTYAVRPGSIVEKRIDDEAGEGSWNRYLVMPDGTEVLVAMKGDQERNLLVEKYLRREISQNEIIDQGEG